MAEQKTAVRPFALPSRRPLPSWVSPSTWRGTYPPPRIPHHQAVPAAHSQAYTQLINAYAELGSALAKTSIAIADFNKVLAVTADPKEQAILMAGANVNLPFFAALAPAPLAEEVSHVSAQFPAPVKSLWDGPLGSRHRLSLSAVAGEGCSEESARRCWPPR